MSSRREIKAELMQLVNEVSDNRLHDLLLTIRAFADQEAYASFDDHSPEFLEKLNQSLLQAETGQVLSSEEVFKEVRRGLQDRMDSTRKRGLH
ncbi:hypothetical protein [Dyadobacter sp. SG02]|uniref:hypothetical protein n=1 Tax=Dyadobacter sp. SG02 TaxID=1855291 RepID=UPI0015A52572|nr:hypothetical protein [Dyadobacter sp. SG02]